MTFCARVGRIASKSPAGNTITAASRGECTGGVVPAGRNEPELLKELLGRPDGQDVVAERVQRPVVTEPVVEVHREGRQVGRRRSTRVVGDEQRAAGRDAAQVPNFGAEVALGDRPQEADDSFGQLRIPLGDLRTRWLRRLSPAVVMARPSPSSSSVCPSPAIQRYRIWREMSRCVSDAIAPPRPACVDRVQEIGPLQIITKVSRSCCAAVGGHRG